MVTRRRTCFWMPFPSPSTDRSLVILPATRKEMAAARRAIAVGYGPSLVIQSANTALQREGSATVPSSQAVSMYPVATWDAYFLQGFCVLNARSVLESRALAPCGVPDSVGLTLDTPYSSGRPRVDMEGYGMATTKQKFPKTGEFGNLSEKLVRHYRLPNGTRFALRRKGRSTSSRPFLRADLEVRRKYFRREEHPAGDAVSAASICRAVEMMLYPGHPHGGVVIIRPDGEVADGKTHLRSLRALPARPTQADRDAAEIKRQLIQEVRSSARTSLMELEEAIEDPHTVITEAVLLALEDRYDAAAVRDAVKRLRL